MTLPLPGGEPEWGRLAHDAFDVLASRWENDTCGGGIRWQVYPFNDGYGYKYRAAHATCFQLAVRLARYTGNTTYSDWAEQSFQWMIDLGLLNESGSIYDGLMVDGRSLNNHKAWWSMH